MRKISIYRFKSRDLGSSAGLAITAEIYKISLLCPLPGRVIFVEKDGWKLYCGAHLITLEMWIEEWLKGCGFDQNQLTQVDSLFETLCGNFPTEMRTVVDLRKKINMRERVKWFGIRSENSSDDRDLLILERGWFVLATSKSQKLFGLNESVNCWVDRLILLFT